MKKSKKTLKILLIIAGAGLVTGIGAAVYLFNMPHRNILTTAADYETTAAAIVTEYMDDPEAADTKYLSTDGNSKILIITGVVASVSTDFNDHKVLLLQEEGMKAGVKAFFTAETNHQAEAVKTGDKVQVKGVIRSGAAYEADLDMYIDAVLEKSSLVQ